MSRIIDLWRWCHGYENEVYNSVEILPGGWKSFCVSMDNNSNPNDTKGISRDGI